MKGKIEKEHVKTLTSVHMHFKKTALSTLSNDDDDDDSNAKQEG